MTITRGPEAVSPNRNPVFEFNSDAVDVEYACRLNGRAFTSCNSPKAYTNLADGAYTFEVQGRDAFGNVSVAGHRFVVDQSAPVLTTPGFGQNAVTGQDVTIARRGQRGCAHAHLLARRRPGRRVRHRRSTSPASRSVSTRWSSPPRTAPATSAP